LLSALLAVSAAGEGHRVLLVDADDFVGPLALTLGVTPRASWTDLRAGRATPADVALPVSATLTLVAGGAPRLSDGTAAQPINAAERKACMRRVSMLAESMDLVVIDCGARLDSVLGALTPHAAERLIAVSAGSDPVALAATYALCKAVGQRHSALPVDILVNRHEGSEAARCYDAIDAGARQFLGLTLRLAGAIPADPTLDAALRAGMPFPDAAAGSPAAIAAHEVVMRVLAARTSSRSGT
jgi:MinD-like ATPase involved in chromosome partitioning or flagellar assembly